MPGTEHFKSPESYRKYRAYTHIHGIKTHARDVIVAGRRHRVHHSMPRSKDRRRGGRRG